ncbi:hypothetical protein DL770_008037 [Monosporascus sp. CRB-9-2]|nr:hypothetical protein DL770_008037 [Monosporascus sp. CRB-9-2]
MQPWIDLLRKNFERGFAEVLRYDEMTFRHYLRTVVLWPHDVIDFVELVMDQANQYDQSFTDLMMQTLHFNTPGKPLALKGGLSRITSSAANALGQENILRNAPVREICPTAERKIELVAGDIVPRKRTFGKIILAMPPALIRNIRIKLHWMAREPRVKLVLEDLDTFFSKQGVNTYDQFIDTFDVRWPSEVSSGNTMYFPGQFSKCHEVSKQPEGDVFFAGEDISRHHTWVAGAVESAHYAVEQVLAHAPWDSRRRPQLLRPS